MTNYNKIIKDFWNKEVKNFYKDNPSEFLCEFFKKIKNKKFKKVLDIGCGAGRNIDLLYKLGFDIYGCDLNKKMVLEAQKRLPPKIKDRVIISNMLSLPYSNNSFDFVVSNGVFHNARSFKDFSTALEESTRVLKNDGNFLFNVFIDSNIENEFIKDNKEKYLYFTKKNLPIVLLPICELIYLASRNGLKLLSFQKKDVSVSTGERKVFKGVFIKAKQDEIKDVPFFNTRVLIDINDKEILRCISYRMNLVRNIFQHKKKRSMPIFDYKREKEIRSKLLKFSNSQKFNLNAQEINDTIDFLLRICRRT